MHLKIILEKDFQLDRRRSIIGLFRSVRYY